MSNTPGPWEKMDWDHSVWSDSDMIADCVSDNAEADALLIAAAPDLLEACEVALNDRMFKEWPKVATLLKNAIAKAKGG